VEIRCPNKKHGELEIDEGFLKVKCSSRLDGCGAGSGMVVIHKFDLKSGKLVETFKFKNPQKG